MDEFDHPDQSTESDSGLTVALAIFAAGLCLFVCLLSLGEAAQVGPDVGAIVSFDPRNGPRYWSQPGIAVVYAEAGKRSPACTLMPSVMAATGGSLIVEAKETSRPPSFRMHWSGQRTALGPGDCGRSADLILQLVQLRALATVAGGDLTGQILSRF